MRSTPHHLIRQVPVLLAVAVAMAPAAAAQDLRSPDTRWRDLEPVSPAQDLRTPDTRDASGGAAGSAPVVEFVEAPTGADGFDWGDAGLGAAAAIGLVLSGAGVLSAARIRHRPTAA